jgi:hypothetical protein
MNLDSVLVLALLRLKPLHKLDPPLSEPLTHFVTLNVFSVEIDTCNTFALELSTLSLVHRSWLVRVSLV